MRRITGLIDSVEHVILEHDDGQVECPSDLAVILRDAEDRLPTGEALLAQCRVLFGDTIQVREI